MSDFRFAGKVGRTIRFEIAATRTLDSGVVQSVDLTLAGTQIIATGRLTPQDAAPVFTRDYYQAGGQPNGGIEVGGALPVNVAQITIPPTEPGILALTKTTYVLVDVELVEQDGTKTTIASGVIKVRA